VSAGTALLSVVIAWLGGVGFGWILGETQEEKRRDAEWWAERGGGDK
jgi:hypothetical protein